MGPVTLICPTFIPSTYKNDLQKLVEKNIKIDNPLATLNKRESTYY